MRLSCYEFAQMFERTPPDKRILVDVRNKEEVIQGKIEKSINIPLGDLENRIKEISANKEIFIFCKSGGRAEKAKLFLEHLGFTKTRILAEVAGYEELKNLIK